MPTTRIPYGVLDGRYVNTAGDTMLGELTLAGAPTLDLHAATKEYVDDAVGVGGHTHNLDAGATDVTATAAEVNLLDLSGLSIGQVLRATGAASAAWGSIQAGDLPTGIDAAKIADGSISNTEYQYLNGVTSAIQTQLDAKAADSIVLKKDGSVALTANWDIGDTRKILADGIMARDTAGLELYDDGGNGIFIEDGGQIGIGTNSPEAPLNVYMGSAGTVSPNSLADDVVIESNDHVGISLLAPDSKMLGLYMGSPQSNQGMRLYYYPPTKAAIWQVEGNSFMQYNHVEGSLVYNEDGNNINWRIESAVYPWGLFLRGSDGFVGVNTVAPGRRLDALDASNPQLRLTHTAGSVYTDFRTVSDGYLFINPSGNRVGIGTSSPSQALEVAGSAVIGAHDTYHKLYVSRFSSSGYSFIAAGDIDRDIGVGLAFQYRNVNGSLATGLTIDVDGKLGIGIAPPTGPARRLEIIDPSASQLRLTQLADTNYVDFLTNVNGDLTITPSGSKVVMAKALEVDGAFDHDGPTFGVFGATPASLVAPYTVTNAITDRSFDADNTTVAELADVVATIIDDLKTYGFFQ